jgi:hypothetical protein
VTTTTTTTTIIIINNNNPSTEIHRMWNMKCFVIPVTIGATGIVTKRLRIYLATMPGKHFIDSLK